MYQGISRDVFIDAKDKLINSGTLRFISSGTYKFNPEWKEYFKTHSWKDYLNEESLKENKLKKIEEQDQKIRDLDEQNKSIELIKNYKWLIGFAITFFLAIVYFVLKRFI